MDTLRGNFDSNGRDDDQHDYDPGEDEAGAELPPAAIGTDERRMQVRAYNHWASLLADRNFPSIEDLEPDQLPDFGPHSVLLDFSREIGDPAVQYLGEELAEECGTDRAIDKLSDVPSRSLLSRITDHYMQILANQAPIGFEAEFVNQRGATILYRGILLPFSSDDDTIDFIYGVINWKEMADQATADELLLEIDQALGTHEDEAAPGPVAPVSDDWADGPHAGEEAPDEGVGNADWGDDGSDPFPHPTFGAGDAGSHENEQDDAGEDDSSPFASLLGASPKPSGGYDPEQDEDGDIDWNTAGPVEPALTHPVEAVAVPEIAPEGELGEGEAPTGLHDCLASARELAQAARSCEDRSRAALYAAVGRAYDVSLAAQDEPEEFDALVAENGLSVQERAPMTPVVKLVFGADYDKTRLTEYAAVLSHAHRIGIERGHLGEYLGNAEGGLKGVVQAERRIRREENGKPARQADRPREKLAKQLRTLEPVAFGDIAGDGSEFGLVLIRRAESGEVTLLGEVPEDVPLLERAARKLLG